MLVYSVLKTCSRTAEMKKIESIEMAIQRKTYSPWILREGSTTSKKLPPIMYTDMVETEVKKSSNWLSW